ncbi:MAG: type II secretion system protein GspC [Myxococcota bacterium]
MASPTDKRFKRGLLLATLALCAFFLAQGATALLGAEVLDKDAEATAPRRRGGSFASPRKRHDPNVILRRNIFNSALGDLTQVDTGSATEIDGELVIGDEEEVDRCQTRLRLAGTAVVPGDLERSLAVIVGTDQETKVHQGTAEVEDFRIRAIHADSVFLQTGGDLCKLAMFVADDTQAVRKLPKPVAPKTTEKEDKKKRVKVDRNAGLSDEEIAQGIEKVNDTTFNIRRTLLNKVLDSAGRLIGIAAVSPKMENGKSVGMQIRGIRKDTLIEKLGLKNQDILESVNGEPLSSPDSALGAYTTLRTSDKFVIAVNREGESMQITYNLN